MKIDTSDLISVTEASNRGLSKLVSDAESGHTRVILRNNLPVAVITSTDHMERLSNLEELEEDLKLLLVALARLATDTGELHALDDVIAELGIDTDELED